MILMGDMMTKLLLAVLVLLCLSAPAGAAEEPRLLGTFGAWKAYAYDDTSGKVCFMSSAPAKSEISVKNAKRGDIYLFVTHWVGEKAKNVVSVALGYPPGGNAPTLAANGKTFTMFAEGEVAWAKDPTTDTAIADALQKGSTAVVKGASKRGTRTTDTYDLSGSGDAYKAITEECKM